MGPPMCQKVQKVLLQSIVEVPKSQSIGIGTSDMLAIEDRDS